MLSPSSDGSSSSRGLLEARGWKNAAGAIGIVKEGRAGAIAGCGAEGDLPRSCQERLKQERSDLQKSNPVPFGFFARPKKRQDGSVDFLTWTCGIMPKKSSAYALPNNGCYEVRLVFSVDFPIDPPIAFFEPAIFHTNVFLPGGAVCLSILLHEGHHKGTMATHWSPSMTIKDILLGLQALLDEPNPYSIANDEACEILRTRGKSAYEERVKKEVQHYEQRLEAFKKKRR